MSADWSRVLASPEYLGELYEGTAPAAGSCDPFYVHIDERNVSVTLGFSTRILPANAPAEWREKEFNAFDFYLAFEGVTDLRVTGWGASEAKNIGLAVHEHCFDVVLGTQDSGITFRAATARLARTHAYLASGSP
ncbi:Imm50 family immunity protein [Streptomyces sp. NPDC056683]|uniref:Imm50 family immunity protein n=1 Tax=Streptomyces sp. NPDC056683 TaxID=3345910 RepID=UPI00367B5729